MLTIEIIRERLAAANLSQVARDTGLHYNQVWRIATGVDTNPTYKTMARLTEWAQKSGGSNDATV